MRRSLEKPTRPSPVSADLESERLGDDHGLVRVMVVPDSLAWSGSSALRSLPRRSLRAKLQRCSCAPLRSESAKVASEQFAQVRSASRNRTPWNVLCRRSAPENPTNDQSPPVTRIGRSEHPRNVLPVSLHPENSASKKLQFLNAQFVNALSVWLDTLKRTSVNVHSLNRAPRVDASDRSMLPNSHRTYWSRDSSSAYQSSFRKVASSIGSATARD